MKKVLGFVALAFAFLTTASASELWWTINDTDGTISVDGKDVTWDSAKLCANKIGYNYIDDTGSTFSKVSLEQLQDIGMAATELGSYGSAYTFYIELYNGDNVVGRSFVTKGPVGTAKGAVSYSDLSASVFIDAFETPSVSPYTGFATFTTANVVPEPTSGLLVLIGALALGLKRKREIV